MYKLCGRRHQIFQIFLVRALKDIFSPEAQVQNSLNSAQSLACSRTNHEYDKMEAFRSTNYDGALMSSGCGA